MSWRTRVVGAAAVAGVGLLAARTVERRAVREVKGRTDDRLDPLFDLPPGVIEHDIASRDGGSLRVIERGQGRPLLLVHGITLQSSVWAPQLNMLADRFRVLAVDVRGHGRSVAGSNGFGRGAAAEDLATVLEHFDLHQAVIVGHSMGGMIAMEFAGSHAEVVQERVDGFVFMATAGFALMPAVALPVAKRLGRHMVGRLHAGRRVPNVQIRDDDLSWLMTRLAFGAQPPSKAVDQVRQFVAEVPQSTMLPSGVDLLEHDPREALRATHTPSLVLVGSRDLLTPVYAAKRIAEHLPKARLIVLPQAGHQLMQERPFEVADILDEFVTELQAYDGSTASTASIAANGRLHAT